MNGTPKRGRLLALLAIACGAIAMLALPGLAAAKDRNHDRIPDRWERKHKLSLKVNQARRDQDSDGLRNRAEFLAGTNPRSADSDGDGLPDGEENAGTVASFDPATGKLTIALFGGESITGFVTEETEIECGCGHPPVGGEEGEVRARSGADDGPEHDLGDDNGEESSSGDHQGEDGSGHDLGDDNGEDGGQGGSCSVEDLTEGTPIQEAELHVEGGRAVFEKIELGR